MIRPWRLTKGSDNKDNFSRDLVYGYSRAKALKAGVLIHVSNAVYKHH
jgi:hypothetical protein